MLSISNKALPMVNSGILISGSARSGTTITGRIIHSMKGVEYVFEPPVLFSLFSLIHEMPEKQWKLLYETYLYEEHFINAISGRNINCNKSDDSSIYRVKSEKDVNSRLDRSLGKMEAEELFKKSVIAYKMPDIVPRIPKLLEYYPNTHIIIVNRGYIGTLNSLAAKRWFDNENANKNLIWPFVKYKEIQIPFWVEKKDYQKWYNMSSLDRCAYYYLMITKAISNIPNRTDIMYEELINNPENTVKDLAEKTGLSFGEKTREIISSIKPTKIQRDHKILEKVSPSLRKEILSLSEQDKSCYA